MDSSFEPPMHDRPTGTRARPFLSAAIFDFDGLLVDTNALWKAAEHEAFSAVGVRVSDDDQAITAAMTTREVARYWYSRQPWKDRSLSQLEADVIERVSLGLTSTSQTMRGVPKTLQLCQALNIRLAVATNAPRQICVTALQHLGIAKHFEVIRTADDVSEGKPSPAVYNACIDALGISPDDAVVLEDSPPGARAAKRAGLFVIGIPSDAALEQEMASLCDRCLSSLNEITPDCFESISGCPAKTTPDARDERAGGKA